MQNLSCLVLLALASSGGLALAESGLVPLAVEEKGEPARVEFSFRLAEPETVASIEATANGGKVPVQFTPFAEGTRNTSAFLFLLDATDPKRAKTVEANRATILRLVERADPAVQVAVYSFAANLDAVAEFGTPRTELAERLGKVKAAGLATELYRNAIEAMQVLAGVDAARKALVLISDGRAEDTTFTLEQVVARARELGVVIYGMGFAETPQGTIHLQSLRRLAAETGGPFAELEAGTRREPEEFAHDFYAHLLSGGVAVADLANVPAGAAIDFEVRTASQRALRHTFTRGSAPATAAQPRNRRVWPMVAGALFLLAAGCAALAGRKAKAGPRQVFARLKVMDSDGTEHAMTTTALRVGRGADNDLTLRNDSISRHHAEIHRARDGSFAITDLGAGNGVLVNGQKVERAPLKHEDVIELGEVRLRFLVA
jgi:Mg-chelatase subunit ChlD